MKTSVVESCCSLSRAYRSGVCEQKANTAKMSESLCIFEENCLCQMVMNLWMLQQFLNVLGKYELLWGRHG
jgi:hypothetical protein